MSKAECHSRLYVVIFVFIVLTDDECQIMDLMYCLSLFMLLVNPAAGPSMVSPLVDYVVREKNKELVDLFQILWRHRHDFLQDPDHDPLHLFRRPQNDYVGKIVLDFATTLETFRQEGR